MRSLQSTLHCYEMHTCCSRTAKVSSFVDFSLYFSCGLKPHPFFPNFSSIVSATPPLLVGLSMPSFSPFPFFTSPPVKVGDTNLSGCMTKQQTKVMEYDAKVKPHVSNAGSMIEDMEIDLR